MVLVLFAAVGDLLVSGGYRFPVEVSWASRLALALIALVLVPVAAGWLRSRRPTADLPGRAGPDRWFLPLLGLGLSCVTWGC